MQKVKRLRVISRTQLSLDNSEFAPYAQAIGWVCMRQAHTELVLMNFLCEIIEIPNEQSAQSLAFALESTQSKLRALKGLAASRRPNDDWFGEVEDVITEIETLSASRNRFAHDVWMIHKKTRKVHKLRFRVQIHKANVPGEDRELNTLHDAPMELEEMYKTADAFDAASKEIDRLRKKFHSLRPSRKKRK